MSEIVRVMGMSNIEPLIEAAKAARANAYAPYSRFAVGAAIRAEDGQIYAGTNVENAAFPESLCAEACAIAVMVAAGARHIESMAVVAEGAEPCPPCGGCLQRLREFAGPDLTIHLHTPTGRSRLMRLADLLPVAFAPGHLPA